MHYHSRFAKPALREVPICSVSKLGEINPIHKYWSVYFSRSVCIQILLSIQTYAITLKYIFVAGHPHALHIQNQLKLKVTILTKILENTSTLYTNNNKGHEDSLLLQLSHILLVAGWSLVRDERGVCFRPPAPLFSGPAYRHYHASYICSSCQIKNKK